MKQISTADLLKACDIRSSKTLTRWHQRKLIPPPSIQTHPNGRGKMSYWPAWVPHRIRDVKKRLAGGSTLEQIADELGSDWAAEEKKWLRKKPDLKKAWARAAKWWSTFHFAENGTDQLYDFLRSIGIERPGISERLERALSNDSLIEATLKVMRSGCSPVIVMTAEETRVVADFVVTALLTEPAAQGRPMIVFPIRDLFAEAFKNTFRDLPAQPTCVPAKCVLDQSNGEPRLRNYRVKKGYGFALDE
jgi:hypothetical protein